MKAKYLTIAGILIASVIIMTSEAKASPLLTTETSLIKLIEPKEEIKKQRTQITHKVVKKDNLTKLAKKYKVTPQRIFDRNKHIKSPDAISVGQKLVIPDKSEKLKTRKFPVAITTRLPGISVKVPKGAIAGKASYNGFEWGWCTYFAQSQRMDKKFRGDAREWMAFVNGTVPRIGAVAVSTQGWAGHVAIVIKVKKDTLVVQHMNWRGFGVISTDEVPMSYWSGYVY